MDRRAFIKGVGSSLVAGCAAAWPGGGNSLLAMALGQPGGGGSLREKAAARGLFYGAATHQRLFARDPAFSRKFAEECGALVTEVDLKWNASRPTPDTFRFAGFDALMEYARKQNMLFRGCPLVWHETLPSWFSGTVNSANAERFLVDHITAMVKRHAGKVHSWDVVNEPMAVWHNEPNGLRTSSPWFQLLGPQYIDLAFRTAAKADPKAMLVLNDYHLEQGTRGDRDTRSALLKLLSRARSSGVPIHALGIEAHLGGKDYDFDPKSFRAFLRDVAALGLKIIITELDVNDRFLPADFARRDAMVASMYGEFLSVALDEKAVIGVLTWGLSDKYCWISQYFPREDGLPARSLPLDENFNQKPAYKAIARAFDSAPKR